MSEKKSNKIFWDCWTLVESLLLIASGVMAIFWADKSIVQSIAIIFAASFIILDAVSRFVFMLVQYDKEKKDQESTIIVSGIEITIGVVVILLRATIMDAIKYTMATILIALGGLLLIFALVIIIRKQMSKIWLTVVEVIGGAFGVALGVVILIKMADKDFATMVVGIILALVGAVIFVASLINLIKDKKAAGKKSKSRELATKEESSTSVSKVEKEEKKKDDNVIDVEVEDSKKQIEGDDKKKIGYSDK